MKLGIGTKFILLLVFFYTIKCIKLNSTLENKSRLELQEKSITIQASTLDFYDITSNLLTTGIAITLENTSSPQQIQGPLIKSKSSDNLIYLYYKDINCQTSQFEKNSFKIKTINDDTLIDISYKSLNDKSFREDLRQNCNRNNRSLIQTQKLHREDIGKSIKFIDNDIKNWEEYEKKLETSRKTVDEDKIKIDNNQELLKEKAEKLYLYGSNLRIVSKLNAECKKLNNPQFCKKFVEFFKLPDDISIEKVGISNGEYKLDQVLSAYKEATESLAKEMDSLTNKTRSYEQEIVKLRMDMIKRKEEMIDSLFKLDTVDLENVKNSFIKENEKLKIKLKDLEKSIEDLERSYK